MSEAEQRRPESDDGRGARQPGGSGDDSSGSPRPDAVIPALDETQAAALRAVGSEWDKVSADPQAWREALPVDPAVGAYTGQGAFRPARFTRVVSVAGQAIASGVAAITSAFPSLRSATVWIGVAVIVVLLGNLRGVRQAGATFAVPTYAFIVAIGALVIAGLVHAAARGFSPAPVVTCRVTCRLDVLAIAARPPRSDAGIAGRPARRLAPAASRRTAGTPASRRRPNCWARRQGRAGRRG
jgi:hypothetical protein